MGATLERVALEEGWEWKMNIVEAYLTADWVNFDYVDFLLYILYITF